MASAGAAPRVVLVTGAARGLGASIARSLGARGHPVAVNARPGGTSPAATVDVIRAAGGDAEAFVCDVASAGAAPGLIRDIAARFGRLDAIVLGATPSIRRGRSVLETT